MRGGVRRDLGDRRPHVPREDRWGFKAACACGGSGPCGRRAAARDRRRVALITGRALAEFARWAAQRSPASWFFRRLEIVPMPFSVHEDISRYLPMTDDPEILNRRRSIARMVLDRIPEVRDELVEQGIEEGLKPLAHMFERRLQRPLAPEEHHALRERF